MFDWFCLTSPLCMFDCLKCVRRECLRMMPFFFRMWCILVLARRAGSPLRMTRLRIVGRKQEYISASVPLDPLLLFFSLSLFPSHPFAAALTILSNWFRDVLASLQRLSSSFSPCSSLFAPASSLSLVSHPLTFWLAGLVGRTARWLYLFVWTADGLACWLVVEISGLPIPHVVHLFIYPSVHVACLSFFFSVCHLYSSSTACQDSSLCQHKKKLFFFSISLHTSKFVISCTLS